MFKKVRELNKMSCLAGIYKYAYANLNENLIQSNF